MNKKLLSKTELEKLIKDDDQSVKLVQKKKTGVRLWGVGADVDVRFLPTPTPTARKTDLITRRKIENKKNSEFIISFYSDSDS